MEIKHVIALILLLLAFPAASVATTLSQRARDAAFFLLTTGAVLTELMDVNFFGQFWYRGTTRGIEISVLDILAFSLLAASLLKPRYGGNRWYWPASLGLLLAYFFYAGFSVLISEPKLAGLWELSKILRGILVFLAAAFFVRTRRELSLLVAALGCAVCFESLLGFKERLWDGIYRVPATFDHPNSFSMYLCL
ncbi:MAG: hypothetical protein KGJ37_01805, partial [Verrucomicrobiota bacterium]|nr:hypothetical protein [Verrucomicrobiota bacterium]